MKITRTANAGVCLTLDGKRLLLDGVCNEVFPYIATPEHLKSSLKSADALIYTHAHADHFDESFNCDGTVIGPVTDTCNIGDITVTAVKTRHIGKSEILHSSYIIEGSKTVWFMGDASPDALRDFDGTPDIIIAPFAYASSSSSLKRTFGTGAKHIIILHLPEKENDIYSLWDAVLKTTEGYNNIHIPNMEQTLHFN